MIAEKTSPLIWLFENISTSQAPNRIQHDQELCVLHPMQLWYTKARHVTHLKEKWEEHQKVVCWWEVKKSSMAAHIWIV